MGAIAPVKKESLDAATAAGNGQEVNGGGRIWLTWSYATTGSPTSVSIKLQVKLHPDETWFDWGTAQTGTSSGYVSTQAIAAHAARLVCSTLSGGTNPTITGYIYWAS